MLLKVTTIVMILMKKDWYTILSHNSKYELFQQDMEAYGFAHDTPIGSTIFSNKLWEPMDLLMIPFTHNIFLHTIP